jgi:uncharacterized protein (TIGR02598 family)
MTFVHSRDQNQIKPQGFTLAEVLFAMAIFVFGVLVLVATLPNGLASMQSARRQAAEVRIYQHLQAVYQAELDRSPADLLPSTLARLQTPATFFFDDRGDPLRSAQSNQAEAALAAQARLEEAAMLPGETVPSPFIHRLRIRISERWRESNSFADPSRYRQRMLPLTLTTPTPPQIAPATDADSSSP